MSRYIDADAMKADLDTIHVIDDWWFDVYRQALKDYIDKQPTTDVVEVVRCKDCIFNNDGWCGADHLGSRWIESEDYCSFGERKDNE